MAKVENANGYLGASQNRVYHLYRKLGVS